MPSANWRDHWRENMFPLRIVSLVRSGVATDWYSLCEAIDIPVASTPSSQLQPMVNNLVKAGILLTAPGEGHNFQISLAPNWTTLQHALGISLTTLAQYPPEKAMYIQPFYAKPVIAPTDMIPDIFVLMPFQRGMQTVYERGLKDAAKALQMSIVRADDLKTLEHIMNDVWKYIYAARFIIVDCTNENPNVFYEMGIAHTLGKPVIVITQNPKSVPFDIKQVRYITYKNTPKGLQALTAAVMAILGAAVEVESLNRLVETQ